MFNIKNKKIYTSIFQRYILFIFFIILVFVVGIVITTLRIGKNIASHEYAEDIAKFYIASSIVKNDYKNIDASKVESVGGWVEILDSNRNLVYVMGKKKDSKNKYTEDEILKLVEGNLNRNKDENAYLYSIVPLYNGGKKYYCMVKTPSSIISMEIDKKEATEKYITRVGIIIIQGIFAIFISFIIISILYARWTSKKMVKPLKEILEGINRMIKGDYSTRINFKAENEFSKIKEAFNFMAEKIEKSEQERDRVERYKRQLFTDISHDLKTPITSIQGYSKALYDEVVEDEAKKKIYLKTIYEKSNRLTNLVDNIHELSKLDNEFYNVNKESVDICEFLREIVLSFYNEIEEKKFDFVIDIPEREITYNIDKNEMFRAISNIIYNALKYNENGTKFKIQLKEFSEKIQIIIADNGIGIDDNLKESIFEAFTRGDLSRLTTGGTGIGLSISHKILEKHGGNLYLDKSEEYKTIFTIELSKMEHA